MKNNKNSNNQFSSCYEDAKKVYLEFSKKIKSLHVIFIGEGLIYDYMRNFFMNNQDDYSYSVISAINDAMAEITEIGTRIFLENKKFFRTDWFYLTAFIYYINQMFENFLEILLKAKIITGDSLKSQEIKFINKKNNKIKLNNNYVLIVNLIRKLLHHSFETFITYEELDKIKDYLDLEQEFLDKLKECNEISFSLVNFFSKTIFSEKCSISLEVKNFSSKYSKNVNFEFNLYDILKKYFSYLNNLIDYLLFILNNFIKLQKEKFNKWLEEIKNNQNTNLILSSLRSYIFASDSFFYKSSEDLTNISFWICKNLFLDEFLRIKLKDDSLLVKIHNYYIKKTLEKVMKDEEEWMNFEGFFYEISYKFDTFYKRFWYESHPKVEYSYFLEKINSDYIVMLKQMNYWEDETKKYNIVYLMKLILILQ